MFDNTPSAETSQDDRFRFVEWRALLATMPDTESRLTTFHEAADDIAKQFVAGRFAKPTGVDQLCDMAKVYGLADAIGLEEVERIVGAAFTQAEQAKEKKPDPPLTYVDITSPLTLRDWVVPDRVPAKNITLLSGEGAIGKSLLLLQLSVAVVVRCDWLGTLPIPGPVLYLSCEEDDDEINRRLEDIAKHYGVTRAEIKSAGLHVISLAGKDAILGTADRSSQIKPTPLFAHVRAEALRICPALIVIDTVADVFGGNEIDRAQTRHFLTLLRGLAIEINGAVILASHPSLTGINTGSGLSGSTAWHNSVRSRMYFRLADEDDDPELRVLEVKKANYAKVSEQIPLRWKNGVYVREPKNGSVEQTALDGKIDNLFLDLLRRLAKEGRNVSDSRSPTYAPTVFEDEPEAKAAKANRKTLTEAMKRLFAAKKIRVQTEGPNSRRRSKIVELLSSAGADKTEDSNTPSNTPSNTLPTASNGLSTHTPHTPHSVGVGRGALERPPTPTLKGEERFRVVGKAPDGTVCVECHQAAGVFKIKDTSVADSKPAVLHPGCAPIWFGAVPS